MLLDLLNIVMYIQIMLIARYLYKQNKKRHTHNNLNITKTDSSILLE